MKSSAHTDRRTRERIYNRESREQTRRVAKIRHAYRDGNKT
jgi:hypothetical protein